MSLATDIDTDYLIMDSVETVALIVKKHGEDDVQLDGVKALHTPLGKRDFAWAGSIGISPEDTVWNVWVDSFDNAVTLQPGYWLQQADGTNWIIMSCELATLSTRWRCVARKARVNQ